MDFDLTDEILGVILSLISKSDCVFGVLMERKKLLLLVFFFQKQDVDILWVGFKRFKSGLLVYDEFSIAR